jgi:hypothetical protein
MICLASIDEVSVTHHQATLKTRLADKAANICRATAAATGGGKALPIWR